MPFTEEDCRKTTGMRFREVVEIWLKHFKVDTTTPERMENEVLDILIDLIEKEGKAIEGALDVFGYARQAGLKTGLATSSSHRLMNAVLKKLKMENAFDSAVSAEFMVYGKPHPEVFLVCASKLGVDPKECVVIEDSLNGIIAAKAAQMKVFAIPDGDHRHLKGFGAADYFCETMTDVLEKFSELVNVKSTK
jgi:sugar-phosphatase